MAFALPAPPAEDFVARPHFLSPPTHATSIRVPSRSLSTGLAEMEPSPSVAFGHVNVSGVSATSHQRRYHATGSRLHRPDTPQPSAASSSTGGSQNRLWRRVMCGARMQTCLRSCGYMTGDEEPTALMEKVVCACSAVAALALLLIVLLAILVVVALRQPLDFTHAGGLVEREAQRASNRNVQPLLSVQGLALILRQAHQAGQERLRTTEGGDAGPTAGETTTLAAGTSPADALIALHAEELMKAACQLPDLQKLVASLQQVMHYAQAVHAHDPTLGLIDLSDFLLSVKGRETALQKAAAKARREALDSFHENPSDASKVLDWNAALKAVFAPRGASARLRAQLRGFVAVPAAQPEQRTRRPFDDVALLAHRHAWALDEVVPRLAASVPLGTSSRVTAAAVAARVAAKADVYEASSVLNHVYYYPVRRYAAMRAYATATVADTDAWYGEVTAAVQARFGVRVTAQAEDADAAAVPVVARESPLSVLSLPRLPGARDAAVARLREREEATLMPGALAARAAVNTRTIFVSLASYRDAECSPTVLDLFRVARNPHRVYVGLAQQNRAGDTACVLPEMYRPVLCPGGGGGVRGGGGGADAYASAREAAARRRVLRGGDGAGAGAGAAGGFDAAVCFWAEQVRVRDIDARQAKGPTYGRYMAMLLYRGEDLTLVLDSHNRFRPMWDTLGASLLFRFGEPKAALSHYPESYEPNKPNFDPYSTTTAYLCRAVFRDIFGYLQMRAMVIGSPEDFMKNNVYNDPYAREKSVTIRRETTFRLPQPWVAGGFLFTFGTVFRDVPFDPHLSFVFDGEEVLYSMRLWTHGYNIYSPARCLCYHIYGRPSAPKVWDKNSLWYRVQDDVRPRIQFFVQAHRKGTVGLMFPSNTTNPYVKVDVSRYGMGRERTVAQWYRYAGADPIAYTLDGKWCGVAPD